MKVCLLGGSNGIMKNGMSRGIREKLFMVATEKGVDMKFDNYSLGNATSLQRVYELLRLKEKLEQYDLIIIESFLNDINDACYWYRIENIHRDIYYLYNEIAKINTKVFKYLYSYGAV